MHHKPMLIDCYRIMAVDCCHRVEEEMVNIRFLKVLFPIEQNEHDDDKDNIAILVDEMLLFLDLN